jgi:hypothetical protein
LFGDVYYYPRTNLIEKMLDDRMHARYHEDKVTIKAPELDNIRRCKFKDGYDPYDTAPTWAKWLKTAKGLLR